MRNNPPMPEEIDQGFYSEFETRWHVVEVIGRSVLAFFVLVCFLGVFGDGYFGRETIQSTTGNLGVRYEPISRFATPTHFDVTIIPQAGETQVQLELSGDEGGAFGLQQILPQPLQQAGAASHPQIAVAVPEGNHEIKLQFAGVPDKVGQINFTLTQKGGETLSWHQFVAP